MNKTCIKVALLRCENYEHRSLRKSIQRGIELLGGIERFTRRGERIILKPNLLIPASAESAVLTHPAVFRAVGEIFTDAGAELLWGDSPAVGTPSMAARQCGILGEAVRLGIKQAEFSRSEDIDHPEGIRNKSFRIARGIIEADGVVSIPKMKTHGLMKITGAFKNSFGCLPGFQKSEYHLRFSSRADFARMLIDLDALVAPRLYIMDGVVAMEGEGPRSGDPKKMNVIIIGTDPVAVDTVFARLININPRLVPCLAEAEKIYGEVLKAAENEIMARDTGKQVGSESPHPGGSKSPNRGRLESPDPNPSALSDLQKTSGFRSPHLNPSTLSDLQKTSGFRSPHLNPSTLSDLQKTSGFRSPHLNPSTLSDLQKTSGFRSPHLNPSTLSDLQKTSGFRSPHPGEFSSPDKGRLESPHLNPSTLSDLQKTGGFRSPHLNPSELFDLKGIEILGDPIEELIDPTFKIDRSPVREPSDTPLVRFARNLIIKKPKMIPERCVRCGSCIKICPTSPKSVDFAAPGDNANPPVFNYATCIRCYCCHEVCPAKAIELRSFF